jgi:hypothetical protein
MKYLDSLIKPLHKGYSYIARVSAFLLVPIFGLIVVFVVILKLQTESDIEDLSGQPYHSIHDQQKSDGGIDQKQVNSPNSMDEISASIFNSSLGADTYESPANTTTQEWWMMPGVSNRIEAAVTALGFDSSDIKFDPELIAQIESRILKYRLMRYGNETPYRIAVAGSEVFFWFSKDSGELRDFVDRRKEKVPEHLSIEHRISSEQAIESLRTLLNDLSVEITPTSDLVLDFENTFVMYSDRVEHEPQDLIGANWHYRIPWVYKGIETRISIVCEVSAFSGRIRLFNNAPFMYPESDQVVLTKDEAIRTAVQFATQRWADIAGAEVKGCELLFDRPWNFWTRAKGEPVILDEELRLFWSVEIEHQPLPSTGGHLFSRLYNIDAGNGELR